VIAEVASEAVRARGHGHLRTNAETGPGRIAFGRYVTDVHEPMTRRGWLLFAAMSVIWGIPYLLIKVAVKHVEPPVVVFGRTSIAAAVLLVLAARTDALRVALRHWRPVLLFAAIEMGAPWLLLTDAEKRLPSGLTGLLVACVPLFGALAAYTLGDHAALRPVRVVGIAIGLGELLCSSAGTCELARTAFPGGASCK